MIAGVERQRWAAERYMLTVRASFVALLLSFVSHEISDSESIAFCHFILCLFGVALTIQLARIALSRRVGPIAPHQWARAEDRRYGAWHQVIATPFDLTWRREISVSDQF